MADTQQGSNEASRPVSVRKAVNFEDSSIEPANGSSKALRKRTGSVTTTIFTKLLYDQDSLDPGKNGGVWVVAHLTLERNPGLDVVRQALLERLVKKFARMRSVLRLSELGESCFEEVPLSSLDWNYHAPDISAQTKGWTKEDVYKYIGELNEYRYDISKPLFRYLLVPEMADGRASLIACVNHAVGDGLALVAATETLYDPVPASNEKAVKHQGKKPVVVEKLDMLAKVGVFLYGVYHGLSIPLSRPDPPNPLRLPNGQRALGKKVLALAEPISLERVKAVKNKLEGTTINDVLMGLMTMTLKQLFIEEGRYRPGERVTAQFPISMRAVGEGGLDASGEPHNKISYAYFNFDFEGDREAIVWHTKHQIDCIKLSPSPVVVNFTATLANKFLPRQAMLDLVRDAGNLGSAQLSNVPAPQGKVSIFDGIGIDDMSFFLFSPLSCYLGILSYNGVVNAAFNLDAGLNLDPSKMARLWVSEFEKLYEEVMAKAGTIKEPKIEATFYRNVTKSLLFVLALLALALVGILNSFLQFVALLSVFVGLLAL